MVVQKTITLPEPVYEKAVRHAKMSGRTFSGLVRISLMKYFEEIRDE
jgi:predicted DNA-binding protein